MLLDLELWDLGTRALRERKVTQIEDYVTSRGGEVVDQYVGPSITMVRVRNLGTLAQTLLTIEDVASLNSPPEPDIVTGEALDLVIEQLPEMNVVGDEAPLIGIIDSGVNAHPLIEDILVGAVGVPEALCRRRLGARYARRRRRSLRRSSRTTRKRIIAAWRAAVFR